MCVKRVKFSIHEILHLSRILYTVVIRSYGILLETLFYIRSDENFILLISCNFFHRINNLYAEYLYKLHPDGRCKQHI